MTEPVSPAAEPDVLDRPEAGGMLIRGSALRTAAYFISLGLGLLSAPLLTSHLGVVDFGRYVTVTSVVMIANTLAEAGLLNLALREYAARSGEDRMRFLRMIYGLKVVLVALAALGATAFTIVAGYPAVLVAGAAVAGVGLLIANVQGMHSLPLSGQLRLGWTAVLDLVRQLVFVAAVVALVVTGAGLLPFFALPALASGVVLVMTLALTWRELPLLPSFDVGRWRGMVRETLPYAVATAVGILYFRVAVVAMGFVSSESETGLFSASFRLIEVLAAIPYLLATSAFPILARAGRDDQQRLRYALQRLFEVSLLLGTGVAVCMLVGSSFAIDVVTGGDPEYDGAAPVLRIQSVALMATFLIGVWSFALLSLSRYRTLLLANGTAFVLVLALTFALAPSLGARGTGLAMTVTEFVLAATLIYGLVRARPDLRLELRVVPRVAIAAGAALAASLLSGLPSLAACAVAGVVYAALALALRAVPPELGQALLRRG